MAGRPEGVHLAIFPPTPYLGELAERYIPQPVQFRALDAATVVVTQGLGADNRVVVQGASLIAQIR